ncbi:MAG: carbamoyltransferase HypF, partial [Mailhella sp.]|nr:carbamoyltransferase HypF [Mailhella sp.]
MQKRQVYIVCGQVQGVGFRPFIYREAERLGLTGNVRNTPEGVRIEVQGSEESLADFSEFASRLPPLARISSLKISGAPLAASEKEFCILHSSEGMHKGHAVLVSPDVAPCPRCLEDMADPSDRRFGYAFTNCTDCGPRYTITRSIPYDRPVTSMACFRMCGSCMKEYHDPGSRRFHAQPNACPDCGPMLWLQRAGHDSKTGGMQQSPPFRRLLNHGADEAEASGKAAVLLLLEELRRGSIAAIKGLGGFHLVCDAFNEKAIALLRERKRRPHKPLAVMTASLESAAGLADIGNDGGSARRLLESPARPIVICPRLNLPDILAPDTADIGLMLPSTPLHYLLFHPEWCGGSAKEAPRALVMTSGNPHGAPLCLGNREAFKRLSGMADVFLFHDRDILVRVDDSVLFPARPEHGMAMPLTVRRARGYTPSPLRLAALEGLGADSSVFAAGAELKSTFCLTRGAEAFLSQHIGDAGNAECMDFYRGTLRHMLSLLEVNPCLAVRDLHPDYPSSLLAEEFAMQRGIALEALQHHAAHICAVMAEHGMAHPVIGL